MQADPSFRAELEEDVAFECSKLGAIERLRIFGGNSEGVISIRFKTEDAAAECIKVMNGRFFGGRQVVAHMYGECIRRKPQPSAAASWPDPLPGGDSVAAVLRVRRAAAPSSTR